MAKRRGAATRKKFNRFTRALKAARNTRRLPNTTRLGAVKAGLKKLRET